MRPTISVNLGGLQFTFNDTAYRLMSEYLTSLTEAFRAQQLDAAELTSDIESRCAEILAESHDRLSYIITEGDIVSLIDRMGRPEEIVDIRTEAVPGHEKEEVRDRVVPPPCPPGPPPVVRKRLYRIGNGAEIGGVCGGLAAYLGWDPVYVRLATVALAFLSCSTVAVVYIILWLVIPLARTPWQEMELRGESPTLNNIGNSVKKIFGQDKSSDTGGKPFENLTRPTRRHKTASGISKVFSVIAKILLGLVGLICILVVLGLLGLTVAGFLYGINSLIDMQDLQPFYFTKLGIVMCGTIIVGIPLSIAAWLIARALFNSQSDWNLNRAWRMTLFIAWTTALIVSLRLIRYIPQFPDSSFF